MLVLARSPFRSACTSISAASTLFASAGQDYSLGPRYLVDVPNDMFSALTFPDFSGVLTMSRLKYIVMFSLIGSLESILEREGRRSDRPVAPKDEPRQRPARRRHRQHGRGFHRRASDDLRDRAKQSEHRQRCAHSLREHVPRAFLLLFVALVPSLIDRIPLAALAAMLVFTGFRLASPQEFMHMYKIGREQLIIFVSTIVGVLATDLLVGIGSAFW